jgi:predicted PurR-regulated permease PerM
VNIAKSFSEGVSPVIRALLGVVLLGAILVLISWAAPVITPIMVAGFVAALVAPLYFWLQRRGVSSGLALILLVVLVVVVILFIAGLLWVSAQRVIEGVAVYQTGLEQFETEIDFLGIRGASLSDVLSAEQLATILVTFGVWVAGSVADLLFGLVLVAFILADAKRLFTLAETELSERPALGNMPEQAQTVVTYFGVRTRLNLLTGIGVTLLMLILGVDFALLWGVLAFLLSYVPYIGLVVAGIPPVILALAEHGLGRALIVVVGMILVNAAAETILEPRMTGKALKLSPLVVILAFFLFGWLLGATGALLSMPITVTIMLIAGQDERTRWVAKLMGSAEE